MRKVVLGLVISVAVVIGGASFLVYWFVSGDGTRLALEREASAWMGEPVQIDGAEASLFPRAGLHLTNVRVGEPVRLTLASVEVSTDFAGLLQQRIEDAAVVVADSRLVMPLLLARISDFAVVPYGQDKSARRDFRGSDARNPPRRVTPGG